MNKESRDNIVKLDDWYQIFKTIRCSPPYFENKNKNVIAMIRQLGNPSLLFHYLQQIRNGQIYSVVFKHY